MLTFTAYDVNEQLYESGNSLIFRGRQKIDGQPVVLKVLKGEYPTPEELARFRREFDMTRSLDVNGVIDMYALEPYKNSLVMVMEDFGGESLKHLLPERPLELEEFLQLTIRIAEILGAIHHCNVIHKDINPTNIVWNPETNELKIIDFGISTELSREQPEIRNPNVLEGTLTYMSPEQTGRMNRAIDYRTDLYSLGATFYEILTGQPLFHAKDAMELVHCHLAKIPVPPLEILKLNPLSGGEGANLLLPSDRGIRGEVFTILSNIIMKLLAKDPEDRYQSAYGLKVDLEYCLANLKGLQDPSDFTLAQHDIPERFQIPQKLYGRELERATLLNAFERVGEGTTELMLVTGYSGIGKSALVHEIHKPITETHGYFISGKFDQFKRNIPYSALIQAFQGLVRQLLTEPEEQIALWKEKLQKAVGPNGQVMIEVIPEIGFIIDEQPPVPELPPKQTQNRFNYVFQNFVRACASEEHPLVIFLDDLQWADSSSLNLLEVIMTDPNTRFMLIVGAYRDNEVTDSHPLMLKLKEIQKAGAIVSTILLTPLELEHVNQLLTDTLHFGDTTPDSFREGNMTLPLAELMRQKTGGNPFFLRQFLQALYENGLIKIDVNRGVWTWELDEIRTQKMTNNVVELMAGKIQKMPQAAQHVMKLAACIGNQFDLQTLSIVQEHSPVDTSHALWAALQEGLILPVDENYKFIHDADDFNVNYKFLHDRVQQAAYSLIEGDQRKRIHLKIGQLMLQSAAGSLEENIFDIVNHLNQGSELIREPAEKKKLAELNLKAGKKAKATAAYPLSFNYIKTGIQFLDKNDWENHYELTCSLHVEGMEAAFLSTDFLQMEELANIVESQARTLTDKVKAYEIRAQAHIARSQLKEAVQIALTALKMLGVKFPSKPNKLHILLSLLSTKIALRGKRRGDLLDLPVMTNPNKLAAMRIMSNIFSASYIAAPELMPLLIFKQVRLSIQYGNSFVSAFSYANYGLILCGIVGDIESGYKFGKLALQLLEKFDTKEFTTRTIFSVNAFIIHFKDHLKDTLQPFLEGYQIGLETGDLEYAAWCPLIYSYNHYLTGKKLSDLDQEMILYREAITKLKQESVLNKHGLWHQAILNLIQPGDDSSGSSPGYLTGKSYDEEKMVKVLHETHETAEIFQLYFNKLVLSYLFGEYAQGIEYSKEAKKYLDTVPGTSFALVFHFYDSLTQLAVYAEAPRSEKKRIFKTVAANQKKMKKWAHHAPMNYLHKWYLVEAERARVLGNDTKAMEYYDKAIAGAREHEYLSEEAFANELAARFWLTKGKEDFAQAYLKKAHFAYQSWGAKRKVQDLEERYPQLLDTTRVGSDIARKLPDTSTVTSTGETSSALLDLSSVMKASQAISGEIVLGKLLVTMMQIVIENAGAQKGFLLLEKKGTWFIEAEGAVDSSDVKVLQSLPIEEVSGKSINPMISTAIVNYVIRTSDPVLLHDATKEGTFTRDIYVTKQQPKSLLCFPLNTQGKLSGILYLENNLTNGAFTPDRLEVLNLLSAQMAISIENAQLYTSMAELNTAYERFVPHEILSFLKKESIVDVELGNQVEKDMTILFSDIRGFTTLSENMTPQENFNFINSYLGHMEPVIHKYHGFIDKYIGDAIMALFPTNADDALQAAIAMLHSLQAYNQERYKTHLPPIRTGIGLNTGRLMLGTVGGKNRMDGTVISDAVNLTFRLEGLTKRYGASIVISEPTYSRLRDTSAYHIRFLGKVQVKGKTAPVSVFEVYDGDSEELKALKLKTTPDFEKGFQQYYDRMFAEAAACFKQVLNRNPDDKTAKLYFKRATSFISEGVPDNWDGVEMLEYK